MPRHPALAAACLIAALLAAAPARAAQPTLTPTRDVDIAYRVAGPPGAPPAEQRVRWDVAGHRQRIDPPTPGLRIIVDMAAHHLASVRDAEKLVLDIDQPAQAPVAGYTSHGTAIVAGLPCAIWREGADAPDLCLTDDGVLLRVSAGGHVVAEATRVTYAPANPADFAIPPDYRHVARPPTPAKEATP